jgi:predicted ATPase
VSGEQEYGVPPLVLPQQTASLKTEALADVESICLFVHRARAVRPDFALTEENAPFVREICTRLDGLPLAIELAAARVKALSPRAILTHLNDCLSTLASGPADAPARHQSLRAAIRWSHDLLNEEEQVLYRRLAVFSGGLRVEAAQAVADAFASQRMDVLTRLLSLVDKSILRQVEEPDGEPRFYMLQTVRDFSRESLVSTGEEARARDAHFEFYLRLAETAEPDLTGPDQEAHLVALERDQENLRAALEWVLADAVDVVRAARFAAALWRFWLIRGQMSDGRAALRRILDSLAADLPAALKAKLLTADGTLAHNQGDYAAARLAYEMCLALHRQERDQEGEAATLNNLSWIAWRLGDYDSAYGLAERALELHQTLQNQRGIFWAVNNLGWVAQYRGEFDVAVSRFEQCLALQEELHNNRDRGFTLNNLGWALAHRGQTDQALVLLKKAVLLLGEVGDRQLTAFATARLAAVIHEKGDAHTAEKLLQDESLPAFREIGDQWGIAFTLCCLGALHQALGDYGRAEQYYEESLQLRRKTHDKWGIADSLFRLAEIAVLRQDVGRNLDAASNYVLESLRLREEMQDMAGIAECRSRLDVVKAR